MISLFRIDRFSLLLFFTGLGATLAYLLAWSIQDLREHTIEFLIAFGIGFLFYTVATILALTRRSASRAWPVIAGGFTLLWAVLLVHTPPTLSDDMYRYVWDGRVQAEGISPYQYPPSSLNLARLRDPEVWRFINRKTAVTIYPPGAEIAFALLWRVFPDNVRAFQAVAAGMALLAGVFLVGILADLGKSTGRVLVYLWSPLLLFETAHAAHIDGWVLPFVVGALWGRVRERDGLTGFLIGIAAAMKLYPALLLPALWRPRHPQGRWRMPLGFGAGLAICYFPYLLQSGTGVIGFLPRYLREQFNVSPWVSWILDALPHRLYSESQRLLLLITLALLFLVSLLMVLRPAGDAETALRRCLWPVAIVTLLNQNLFSWYMLWLLPLLAIFLQPGQIHWRGQHHQIGLRLDAWTGWWLFCGLVALSYTFFQDWEVVPWAIQLQFWPLAVILAIDLIRQIQRVIDRRETSGRENPHLEAPL